MMAAVPSRLSVILSRHNNKATHHTRGLSDFFSRISVSGNENVRFLSSKSSGSGKGTTSGPGKTDDENEEDPFGVHYEDGESAGNIGPKDALPPNYIRDSATGKFTGKVQKEISAVDATFLNLSPLAKERIFSKRVNQALDQDDGNLVSARIAQVASRIREQDMALNTLGRKVADVAAAQEDQARKDVHVDDSGFSVPLSESEAQSLERFIHKDTPKNENGEARRLLAEADELIPIARKSSTQVPTTDEANDKNPDLDLEWMTASAQRSMAGVDDIDYDPFADLSPADLNPAKLVNRKNAKLIPKDALHHNNLSLLRRYVTPGGQIMNRVQSRLGAKDQRKISKLIKRARHLGFIPHLGQWNFEDNGNMREKNILVDTDWEKKLVERGLVERKSSIWKKADQGAKGE